MYPGVNKMQFVWHLAYSYQTQRNWIYRQFQKNTCDNFCFFTFLLVLELLECFFWYRLLLLKHIYKTYAKNCHLYILFYVRLRNLFPLFKSKILGCWSQPWHLCFASAERRPIVWNFHHNSMDPTQTKYRRNGDTTVVRNWWSVKDHWESTYTRFQPLSSSYPCPCPCLCPFPCLCLFLPMLAIGGCHP